MRLAVVFLVAVLTASACRPPDPTLTTDASSDGPLPEAWEDDFCHFDCFGYSECENNVVTTWDHAPIPCDEWEGECPHGYTYKCQRGCRTDVDSIGPFDDPALMCEEFRPKHLGDPCTEEAHCRPEGDVTMPDGSLGTDYLTCDVAGGHCVAREPPTIPDLYATCDLHVTSPPDGSFTGGVVETDLCSGGVCAWFDDATETCIQQFCTAECATNGDCPPETRCETFQYVFHICMPIDWNEAPISCL